MKLVVYSNKDLDDIEVIVRDKFSDIVNKEVTIPSFNYPPAFSKEYLGNLYR